MEARSLSSLNSLAANPPQYPVKPGEAELEALTLYILRVPGTRDIFLSPFKPQIKSVTAEDIASSLYYVHLRDPADDQGPIAPDNQARDRSPSQTSISRKPLPNGGQPAAFGSPPKASVADEGSKESQWAAPPLHHHPASSHQPKSSPLSQTVTSAEQHLPVGLARIPARKPLGPRTMGAGTPADIESAPTAPALQDSRGGSPTRSQFRDAEANDRQSFDSNPHHPSTTKMSALPGSFSLDLIRRDRSSAGQWNVARISRNVQQSPRTVGLGGSPSKQTSQPHIDISIENSGYAKFRNIPPPSVVEAGPAAIMEALAERAAGRSSDHSSNLSLPFHSDTTTETASGALFSRQITMCYAKSWSATVKEKLQKLESGARAKTGHARGSSAPLWDSASRPAAQASHESASTRPRGYSFLSPWNGRCEFRTGHGGRTLRCTHALEHRGVNGSPSAESVLVSELRFSLPISEVIPATARPKDSQILRPFGQALRSRARSDPYRYEDPHYDDEPDSAPLDLTLGRERAGGGRRGNRAKMGKLIITGDGLKMLDLVVAANVGVWWEAWEKGF